MGGGVGGGNAGGGGLPTSGGGKIGVNAGKKLSSGVVVNVSATLASVVTALVM